MVFTSLISNSDSLFSKPLVTVPSAPTIVGITVTFIFHSFFNPLARSEYWSLFSPSFIFTQWSAGTAKINQITSSFWVHYYFYYYLCEYFTHKVFSLKLDLLQVSSSLSTVYCTLNFKKHSRLELENTPTVPLQRNKDPPLPLPDSNCSTAEDYTRRHHHHTLPVPLQRTNTHRHHHHTLTVPLLRTNTHRHHHQRLSWI